MCRHYQRLRVNSFNAGMLTPLILILQVFKDATLFFSRSTPNLAMVIPAMDHTLTQRFEPAIRAALGLAKKTLNRYYNLTDDAEVYRIAMGKFYFYILCEVVNQLILVLHPCYTSTILAGRRIG
jgi:hypothetical protein